MELQGKSREHHTTCWTFDVCGQLMRHDWWRMSFQKGLYNFFDWNLIHIIIFTFPIDLVQSHSWALWFYGSLGSASPVAPGAAAFWCIVSRRVGLAYLLLHKTLGQNGRPFLTSAVHLRFFLEDTENGKDIFMTWWAGCMVNKNMKQLGHELRFEVFFHRRSVVERNFPQLEECCDAINFVRANCWGKPIHVKTCIFNITTGHYSSTVKLNYLLSIPPQMVIQKDAFSI